MSANINGSASPAKGKIVAILEEAKSMRAPQSDPEFSLEEQEEG